MGVHAISAEGKEDSLSEYLLPGGADFSIHLLIVLSAVSPQRLVYRRFAFNIALYI